MATHCSVLAWRIHGQRSLVGYLLNASTPPMFNRLIVMHTESQISINSCNDFSNDKSSVAVGLITERTEQIGASAVLCY